MFARVAAALSLAAVAFGQVEHGGTPFALDASFKTKASLSAVNKIDLSASAPDVDALLAEDKANESTDKPLRIAAIVEVSADLSQFTADKVADGTLYRLAVQSPGALGLGMNFKTYSMPAGAKMFVYTGATMFVYTGTVRGSFTDANHKHYGGLSVMPTSGDTAVVEIFVPAGAVAPKIELESVAHHYLNNMFKYESGNDAAALAKASNPECFGCSGDCNVNMVCEAGQDWREEAAGVVRILTAAGSSLCSGSMINNVEQDGRQLFLSADHCGGGNADTWILMFNFQTPDCENGAEPPSRDQTVQGTRLLARRGASDFVLLEVVEAIPAAYGAFMNGFNAAAGNDFRVPYSISHPSGDVKKLGVFGGIAVPEGYFNPGDTHWYIAAWDEGMTEGGSSGSPVFDEDKRIRGQLHGGFASCSYPYVDYYGRTFTSWDSGDGDTQNLNVHLDPSATGTRVVDGQPLAALRAKAGKH